MTSTYAIIDAGVVANMAVADAPLYQNWVPAPDGVGIGWHYDGEAFTAPQEPEQPEPTHPQLTSLEYLDLFTEAEQLAVVGATMTVPAVKLWYDRMLAASFVSYADPRTEAGLQALVDAGLLQPQRKAEIAAAMQAA